MEMIGIRWRCLGFGFDCRPVALFSFGNLGTYACFVQIERPYHPFPFAWVSLKIGPTQN